MTATEFAALVETKCLLEHAVARAKGKVKLLTADSPVRAELEAELSQTEARWAAEAPVREARAKLNAAGWFKSDFKPGVWYHKKTKKQLPTVEAIRAAGLAE